MDGGGGSSDSQIALDQASITIENPIEANTDYTIPLNYTVGSEDLEVFYCGNKLQKDVDYIEVGNVGIISNKIQFKTAIGDLDMSGISGFEDFKETLQFAVTGKTALGQIDAIESKRIIANGKKNTYYLIGTQFSNPTGPVNAGQLVLFVSNAGVYNANIPALYLVDRDGNCSKFAFATEEGTQKKIMVYTNNTRDYIFLQAPDYHDNFFVDVLVDYNITFAVQEMTADEFNTYVASMTKLSEA